MLTEWYCKDNHNNIDSSSSSGGIYNNAENRSRCSKNLVDWIPKRIKVNKASKDNADALGSRNAITEEHWQASMNFS